MSPKAKNIIKYLIFLGLGVVLFYLAMRGVSWEEQWEGAKKADGWLIAMSFLMGYLAIVSRGLRWLNLLEPLGYKPSGFRSVCAVTFAYFSNAFIPRSGEMARCAMLNQTDDIPIDKLFGTVVTERVVDFIMLFIFFGIALMTNLDTFSNLIDTFAEETSGAESGPSKLPWILGGILVLGVVALVVMKDWMKNTFIPRVKKFLSGVWEGAKSVVKMKNKGLFIFHTFFIWAMYFFMAYVVFLSLDETKDITITDALLVMVAGGVGMVFPSPGGIGSYQLAVMVGFITLGYSKAIGLQIGNIMWFTQTVMMIVTGALALLYLTSYKLKRDRLKEDSSK